MRLTEFEDLKRHISPSQIIRADDFVAYNRTLLVGVPETDRLMHVYYSGGFIHRLVLDGRRLVSYHLKEEWNAHDLVPQELVYPEFTSWSFAFTLIKAGVTIPFAPYDQAAHDRTRNQDFYAPVRKEIT